MELKWPKIRRAVLEISKPILHLIGKAHTPPHYRSLTSYEVEALAKVIEPGDVLLSRRNNETTNPLIPGFWKHAAMFTDKGRVVEAVGRGVIDNSLDEFCRTKDAVICLRATFANADDAKLAVGFAKSLRGAPYDYLVEHDQSRAVNNAFYCSEVVWWSYDQVFLGQGKVSPFEVRETMGVPTVAPQDFRNATKLWKTVLMIRGDGRLSD